MKKITLTLSLVILGLASFGQSEQYKKGMSTMLQKMQVAANSVDLYQDAANGFSRIADAEKNEWLPKYYASFCMVMQAMNSKDLSKVDPVLDIADKLLSEIASVKESDEVLCLQSFSRSARIAVDPMTRGMKYGAEAAKLLARAKALNPNNPRVYFLLGQSAFYTPEAFGGGKKAAQSLFAEAAEKFNIFTPLNELMPNWGKEVNESMLKQCAE
jgi:hypothetical protein